MPGQPRSSGADESDKTREVEDKLQMAMSTMQDNMRAMTERESKLDSLQARTNDLDTASRAFGKEAKRLQSHYTWQRYRVWLLVGLIVSWAIVALFFKQWTLPWVAGSSFLVGAIFLIRGCMVNESGKPQTRASADAEMSAGLTANTPLE
eukprot:TRINITY_DN3044_c0_g2_i3.p1 TRINITY_DN3044_c0_g2~~TRINITY_DN3044_c0_g2_i3.p1  ORF type:complete len:150 (+),score=21.08 TRINITY_DN3044_c0_g2_i3:120-569(+)